MGYGSRAIDLLTKYYEGALFSGTGGEDGSEEDDVSSSEESEDSSDEQSEDEKDGQTAEGGTANGEAGEL